MATLLSRNRLRHPESALAAHHGVRGQEPFGPEAEWSSVRPRCVQWRASAYACTGARSVRTRRATVASDRHRSVPAVGGLERLSRSGEQALELEV